MRIISIVAALFIAQTAVADPKTMTMTWEPSERADGYVIRRDSCDGPEVYQGSDTRYVEQITGDVTYCIYAYNSWGESDPIVRTAWIDATRPGSITVTIKIEVQ